MDFAKQQPTAKGPADWFTGDVWFDVIRAGQEPSRIRANLVRFSPGARTHWHSHARLPYRGEAVTRSTTCE